MGAYPRPIFNFEGSLAVARRLWQLADDLEVSLVGLGRTRDTAYIEWLGSWGDEYRLRASEEDINLGKVTAALREEADRWGQAWQESVTEMNGVLYAEAVEWQKAYLEQIKADDAWYEKTWDWVFGEEQTFSNVDRPGKIYTPQGGHYSSGDVFATYSRYGDSLSVSYRNNTPGWTQYTNRGGHEHYQEGADSAGGVKDESTQSAETPQPEVSLDASRKSFGTSDGVAQMDLTLIREYLLEAEKTLGVVAADMTAVDEFRQSVLNQCEHRKPYPYGIQALGLYLHGTVVNRQGLNQILVDVGIDRSGVVQISNADIERSLRLAGADQSPGLLSVEYGEMAGMPSTSGFVDDPINAATGNFVQHEEDLSFRGFATAINVSRTYNSMMVDQPGMFGIGWISMLDMNVAPADSAGCVRVQLADGGIVPFSPDDAEGFLRNDRRQLELHQTEAGWLVIEGADNEWRFGEDGKLLGGRYQYARFDVTRDASSVVVSERLSGRSVLYELGDESLVQRAVSSDGRVVNYDYKDGHCVRVDRPVGGIEYEISGSRIVKITDADGVVLCVNEYDEYGRAISQRSPHGRHSFYEYADEGITRITDSQDGPRNVMIHDDRGNLISMIGGDDIPMRIDWDDRDRMVQVTDRRRNVTKYEFLESDEFDLGSKKILPDGTEEEWEYDDLGRLVAHTLPGDRCFRYTYAGEHRLPIRIDDPLEGVTLYERDERGLPSKVVDPDGVATFYSWDADGQIVLVKAPDEGETRFRYNAIGELVAVVGPDGISASMEVDLAGRVVQTVDRFGLERRYRYSAAGRPIGCVSQSDDTWEATYGNNGEIATITDISGSTVSFTYDYLGNQTAVIAPDGQALDFEYDSLGQVTTISYGEGRFSKQRFDLAGNVLAVTDPDGVTWKRKVDSLGRTIELHSPISGVTEFSYHPGGELAAIVESDGSVSRFEIDRLGRVVAATDPLGATTTYRYSRAGRLSGKTTAAGREWGYEYDQSGRLVVEIEPGGATNAIDYRKDGRPQSLSNADGEVTFDYDDAGRVATWSAGEGADRCLLGWAPGSVAVAQPETSPALFELDPRGMVARSTDPMGFVTNFEHDARGRLAATSAGDMVTSFEYDEMGKIVSFHDTSGQSTTFERSPAGRITEIHLGEAAGYSVARDAAGRIESLTAQGGATLAKFEYDQRGLLASARSDDNQVSLGYDQNQAITKVSDANGLVTEFKRDADGHLRQVSFDGLDGYELLRSATGEVVAYRTSAGVEIQKPARLRDGYAKDDAGRILSGFDGRSFEYDGAGRLARASISNGTQAEFHYGENGMLASENTPLLGEREFVYDDRGQLTEISDSIGAIRYEYDDAGRRSVQTNPDGSQIRYRWNDLSHLVAIENIDSSGMVIERAIEYSALGRPTKVDGLAIGWDDAVTGKPIRVGEKSFLRSGATVCSLAADVTTWDDGSADDPWGYRPEESAGVNLGFNGELTIDGLTFMGDRIYDPVSRCFLTRDPSPTVFGQNAAHNSYQFAHCDPINFIDPTGHRPISRLEFDDWAAAQERSRFGSFVQAIKDDPWGSLALAVVVTGGLIIGGPVGVAVVLGAAFATGYGFATKSFNPTMAAASGIIAGATVAGMGALTTAGMSLIPAAATTGAIAGGTGELSNQVFSAASLTDFVNGDMEKISKIDINVGEILDQTWKGGVIGAGSGVFGKYVTGGLSPAAGGSGMKYALVGRGTDALDGAAEGVLEAIFDGDDISMSSIGVNMAMEAAGGDAAKGPDGVNFDAPGGRTNTTGGDYRPPVTDYTNPDGYSDQPLSLDAPSRLDTPVPVPVPVGMANSGPSGPGDATIGSNGDSFSPDPPLTPSMDDSTPITDSPPGDPSSFAESAPTRPIDPSGPPAAPSRMVPPPAMSPDSPNPGDSPAIDSMSLGDDGMPSSSDVQQDLSADPVDRKSDVDNGDADTTSTADEAGGVDPADGIVGVTEDGPLAESQNLDAADTTLHDDIANSAGRTTPENLALGNAAESLAIQNPEQIQTMLGEINDGYTADINDPKSLNCGECAAAVHARFEGLDPNAVASEGTLDVSEMETLTGKPQVAMSQGDIETNLRELGPGSHAVIGFDRTEGPGHWLNAYYDGQEVHWVDGQTGEMGRWPPSDYDSPDNPITNWDSNAVADDFDVDHDLDASLDREVARGVDSGEASIKGVAEKRVADLSNPNDTYLRTVRDSLDDSRHIAVFDRALSLAETGRIEGMDVWVGTQSTRNDIDNTIHELHSALESASRYPDDAIIKIDLDSGDGKTFDQKVTVADGTVIHSTEVGSREKLVHNANQLSGPGALGHAVAKVADTDGDPIEGHKEVRIVLEIQPKSTYSNGVVYDRDPWTGDVQKTIQPNTPNQRVIESNMFDDYASHLNKTDYHHTTDGIDEITLTDRGGNVLARFLNFSTVNEDAPNWVRYE